MNTWRHTIWDCKCHVVWVTKYRYPVLGGDGGIRCRELLRETARAHEMVVDQGPRAHAAVNSAEFVGVARGEAPEGSQVAQASERVLAPCPPKADESGFEP
jgi:Transposase IS200 like